MKDVVIVSGARTAIGAFGGSLKDVSAIEMGALVMREVFKKINLKPVISGDQHSIAPDKLKSQGQLELEKNGYKYDSNAREISVDESIMGCVLQSAQGQNPARQASIYAGIPKEAPACTINKVCGSGLKAITMGAQAIMTGQADVIVAGGMESMSNAPFALKKARWGHRMELTGTGDIHDLMVFDGLYEIFNGYHMGITAENIASLYGISREEQDKLGVLSHQRAMAAIKNGLFKDEIVPVVLPSKKGDIIVDTDERPMETSLEKMAQMKPAFKKDGTVTAGNASGINDGAAAVLMMSADKAKELGLEPIIRIRSFAAGGVDPAYMGLGPVPAIRKALKLAGMTIRDLDMVEINEAFAAQAIGCFRELGLDNEFPNQLGSGISLGHPIGCTGARMVVTAMYQMKRKNLSTGVVSMCIGGGMGMAMIFERV
ncbi:MAG: Acetyl-CoA acetyltransferase [Spirochaetes bacterium ADurb.Bin218]|jgi:acetyl-CoA C-acetyltransferase|nr:acetyl-CoA C-acetyltransferase [Spirochaetota bacterium]OQA97945.1 MAG: Acetyl-CoA acetyltransferase [Spirochaetes bacterium ADurb.Bin218]HOV07991.1 acetyl-CoA C-acetyltransferase [Spirochaetota bacterium]